MANIRMLATGLEFPEGPVVMPDGSVVLVEIRGQRLTRVHPDGRKEVVAQIPGGPNGAALGPDGKMYVCNNGGFSWIPTRNMIMPGPQPEDYHGGSIQRVDLQSGKVETVVDRCGEHGLRGPNDLVFDRQGGLMVLRSRQAPRPRHGCRRVLLYEARHEGDRRGRARRAAGQRHRPLAGREDRLHRGDADRAAVGLRGLRARHHQAARRDLSRRARKADRRSRRLPDVRTRSRWKPTAMSVSRR